jgi:hypothetical protein
MLNTKRFDLENLKQEREAGKGLASHCQITVSEA